MMMRGAKPRKEGLSLKRILYLTDLAYVAKGRDYAKEDIFIADRLSPRYAVAMCHPRSAEAFEDAMC